MRYYVEGSEAIKVDLVDYKRNFKPSIDRFVFLRNEIKIIFYIKKMYEYFFVSKDLVSWDKVLPYLEWREWIFGDNEYNVYRGFLPKSMNNDLSSSLKTNMPGKIIKVLAEEGEKIDKGQVLLILEAMKMENEIRSNMNGIIDKIYVKEGQTIESNVLLLDFKDVNSV